MTHQEALAAVLIDDTPVIRRYDALKKVCWPPPFFFFKRVAQKYIHRDSVTSQTTDDPSRAFFFPP
jgi:hypothetical protein